MNRKSPFINDRNLAILTVVLWILPFAVYLFNTSTPTVLHMSRPFAYSVIWWLVVLLLFVAWAYHDLGGGE
ncbi:hypothetical protein E3E22_00140 [Thermococcus sp. MV5]|uniref:hypothetical protein n=1 Tax=Thermococcus sp. MV5 TaxID=1638272 RepID=UPI00143B3E20|nr:hypothetical protein [Thermococcus sp. MV5]NJE25062.1 hypothetical protein [Thermococcus sp. MV5]